MSVTFLTTVMKAHNKNATGISIPEEVMTTLAGGKKPSVSVTLNGYTYRTTASVMGGEYLIPLSEGHRQASGLKADDPVEVTLAWILLLGRWKSQWTYLRRCLKKKVQLDVSKPSPSPSAKNSSARSMTRRHKRHAFAG
ncbi:hypothetical protein ASG89_23975 [Paenibacillus sp. Soil766]|nr:DUF1905 domain-containing protein [Paenibacillus sp. Soil766]KRF03195.1 hypothetical protein ASG89_23975 [Paenibacillus sp. Soil766]